MAWGPFSAEAVTLDSKLRQLHKQGRISGAMEAIEKALERAHTEGPSNMSYEEFERLANA